MKPILNAFWFKKRSHNRKRFATSLGQCLAPLPIKFVCQFELLEVAVHFRRKNDVYFLLIITPLCTENFRAWRTSFANSVTCPPDDPGIPHCERKCGCDNLPFPSGGPGDTAGDPSFPTAGGGSGPSPGERLGGDYKPVNLATGAVDIVGPASAGREPPPNWRIPIR